MKKYYLALIFLVFTANATFAAQCADGKFCFVYDGVKRIVDGVPKFADYPPDRNWNGKRAKDIDWASQKGAYSFRTKLRAILKKPPNFSGHYRAEGIGCGSGCQVIYVVDTETGKIADSFGVFPIRGAYSFKIKSSLIVIELPWTDEDMSVMTGWETKFMALKDGKLIELPSVFPLEKMIPPKLTNPRSVEGK